ncbi:SET domain-containing protein [Auriculariales sp. MPI-PUGE-AT-0066]|nr:SET domain-containing protein [Auriculariales sp. MPI-PUGE-AT-0066]
MTSSSVDLSSDVFEIRATPHAGRGVFASKLLSSGTIVYHTRPSTVNVTYRVFRREACSWCWEYNSGRTWKLSSLEAGVSIAYFCSNSCQTLWESLHQPPARVALATIEQHLKKALKPSEEPVDSSTPTASEVSEAWNVAGSLAEQIMLARASPSAKKSRKTLAKVLNQPLDADHMYFLLSAVIASWSQPEEFALLRQLERVDTAYRSQHHLQSHIGCFHVLLALLPAPISSQVTSDVLRTVASADVHNSFGVWSGNGGIATSAGEMLGYGIWADGSFFNHQCAPNIADRTREGRCWVFRTSRDVEQDEELTISYLSREELVELDVTARRQALAKSWGFQCGCSRCIEEITAANR